MTWRQHTPETVKSLTDAQLAKGRDKAAMMADHGRTYFERSDGWRVMEMIEREQARRAGTLREPADPGDVRFELHDLEDGTLVWTIDDQGEIIERDVFRTRSEAFDMIEATREHQALVAEAERLGVHPLEIAFAPFGPEWEREQNER